LLHNAESIFAAPKARETSNEQEGEAARKGEQKKGKGRPDLDLDLGGFLHAGGQSAAFCARILHFELQLVSGHICGPLLHTNWQQRKMRQHKAKEEPGESE